MIIYKITNKINGKLYIGQTIQSLKKRLKSHFSDKNSHCVFLCKAIKKYGKENFETSILARCNSIEEMNEKETYYIKLFRSLAPNGYNLDTGGKNKIMSDETRSKMSDSHMGKKRKRFSDEHRQNMSISHTGKPKSEAHRLNISRATSGKNNPNFGKSYPQAIEAAAKVNRRPVYVVELNKTFASIIDASIDLKIHRSRIQEVLNGSRSSFKGLTFKRA